MGIAGEHSAPTVAIAGEQTQPLRTITMDKKNGLNFSIQAVFYCCYKLSKN
jgi:hypothetical protein